MTMPKNEHSLEVRIMNKTKIILAHIAPIAIVLALLALA